MDLEESIKTVINSLASSFSGDILSNNKETLEILKSKYNENPHRFLSMLDLAYFDFGELLESVFQIPEQKNKYIVRFIANGLYEHFHKTRIEKLEGSACCADKSSFVRDMTLKALTENINLSLYTEDKERQAYWSPKTIKDTDEAISLFWRWYRLEG